MEQKTKEWFKGQKCYGTYCGKSFSGTLNDNCRPTPDFKNIIFGVTLDEEIEVFGNKKTRLEIETNSTCDIVIEA